MGYNDVKNNFVKFRDKAFRPYQEQAIEFIQNSQKNIIVLQAPTGFGKSLAAVCAGALHDSFTYLVSSKALQNQLGDDFPEIEVMKGRNNYKCQQTSGTCDECIHGGMFFCPYKKSGCEYEDQKKKVLAHKYRLLNYHYFLFETNYIGRFSGRSNIIICDEGDMVEKLLADFISLTIPGKWIKRLSIPKPKRLTPNSKDGLVPWTDWASKEVAPKVISEIFWYSDKIESAEKHNSKVSEWQREKKVLEGIRSRLDIFLSNVDKSWIFEEKKAYRRFVPNSYSFKPVWTTERLSEEFFFRHGSKFVFMSATFPPPQIMGRLLGQPASSFDYMEIPSSFPIENRRINLYPVGNLTRETWNKESLKIVHGIDEIIHKHEHEREKGLVHSVSYKLANQIMGILNPRLITHNGKNREEIIEYFKNSNKNLILVSPSAERGYDFADDMCRFVIWAKAPFLSLADKLTSKRVYSGNIGALWYRSLAAQIIVQGCGRPVRSKTDYAVTYCLDQQIVDMVLESGWLFPRYFIEACTMY